MCKNKNRGMSLEEAAAHVGINVAVFDAATKGGHVPFRKVRGRAVYSKAVLDGWMQTSDVYKLLKH